MSLTIAIPTFNRAQKLEYTLSIIIGEIEKFNLDIDLIISDNNSTDNTTEICLEYKKRFKSLKYYKQNINIGLDQNIYFLYQKCETEYIWFVSDDDEIISNSITHIIKLDNNNSLSEVNVFEFADSNTKETTNYQSTESNFYTHINQKNFSKSFFKVIMISTLVLKKRDFKNIIFNKIPNSVYPQITLSILLLNNKFGFKHFESTIILRNPGYISGNFFKLYCLGPRIAIRNSKIDQFTSSLLPETEKAIHEYVFLQFQERLGYYISKTPITINLLVKSLNEFKNLKLKSYLLLIYFISKIPRSISLFIYYLFIILKKKSINKANEKLVFLKDHYKKNLILLNSSDV